MTTMSDQFILSASSRSSIADAVAATGGTGPLPVIVASDDYAFLVDNWIMHMEALGLHRYLVVAMDDALVARLADVGIKAGRCSFDGSKGDFWLRRMLIWNFLIEQDIEIIQSDIDAVWLRNPIPEHFSDMSFDMIWSQGTVHPADILKHWSFILCAGLFWARPSPGTKSFFAALTSRSAQIRQTDDQQVINELLYECETHWEVPTSGSDQHSVRGHTFTGYRETMVGRCKSLGLRIALLPHYLFPRLVTAEAGPFVKHVLRSDDPVQRIPEMRAAGCWMLDGRMGKFGIRYS